MVTNSSWAQRNNDKMVAGTSSFGGEVSSGSPVPFEAGTTGVFWRGGGSGAVNKSGFLLIPPPPIYEPNPSPQGIVRPPLPRVFPHDLPSRTSTEYPDATTPYRTILAHTRVAVHGLPRVILLAVG